MKLIKLQLRLTGNKWRFTKEEVPYEREYAEGDHGPVPLHISDRVVIYSPVDKVEEHTKKLIRSLKDTVIGKISILQKQLNSLKDIEINA